MGAATNFGKSDLGINSPTHRNTHAEEDLFHSSNDNNIMNNNIIRNDLLEDMFKTCGTTTPSPPSGANRNHQNDNNQSDTEFNPREDESQEFGDFESAFGNGSSVLPASQKNVNEPKNNDFDFAAFGTSAPVLSVVPPTNSTNSNNLLFSAPVPSMPMTAVPMFGQTVPSASTGTADLLSDFGGLNLSSPMVNGE